MSTPAESWLRRFARRMVRGRLETIDQGVLHIVEDGCELTFGDPAAGGADALVGHVVVEDSAFWERLAWGGSIGAAEAYCDGLWSTPDLTAVIRVLARNRSTLSQLHGGTAKLVAPIRRILHRRRSNTQAGSIRNISAHYDTGNEFFAEFLDPTLTYSCAIYPDPTSTLEAAQLWKLDTICRKLDLQPTDRLVEVGTGWGALAIHAARNYGCEVVTTTISKEQFEYATQAVADAGLESKITILREDYRNLPTVLDERFDKLVSIEMIEAVGHEFLPEYFEVLGRLLKPEGLALVQAILYPDQGYESYRRGVDFIQHYIFPGSQLPSMGRIQECTADRTGFRLVDYDDLTSHYARTLAEWRSRFEARESAIAALGVSEPERRKWIYYFSYCEAGFLERTVLDAQLLWAGPDNRRAAEASTLSVLGAGS